MYQFGNSEPNTQLNYYAGVINQFQAFNSQMQNDQPRILQNVQMRTQHLALQVTSLKQDIKDLASQVRQSLKAMSQQLAAVKKAVQSQRPRRKFKKAIMCPVYECERKYSSKIALNCHIRNKHSFYLQ